MDIVIQFDDVGSARQSMGVGRTLGAELTLSSAKYTKSHSEQGNAQIFWEKNRQKWLFFDKKL